MQEDILEINDNEYQALKTIEEGVVHKRGKGPSQRDIAKALGMSVGMTNNIIKRLAEKGWLVMNKVNGRNLSYALTPEGAKEVAKRGYRYLRRTLGNVVRWKDKIDAVVAKAKAEGMSRVLLIGGSDVEFIVEHASGRHGMVFLKSASMESAQLGSGRKATTFVIYAEGKDRPEGSPQTSSVCYLKEELL